MKQCSKCKVWKETSEFWKSSRMKDGLQEWCKKCSLDYQYPNRLTRTTSPNDTILEKECTHCRITKKYSEFSKSKVAKDGKQFWCKQCVSEQRVIRLSNPEKRAKETIREKEKAERRKASHKTHHRLKVKTATVICERCKRHRKHYAKGLCNTCYRFVTLQNNPELHEQQKQKDKIRGKKREKIHAERRRLKSTTDESYHQRRLEVSRASSNRHPETRRSAQLRRQARLAGLPYDLTNDEWEQIVKDLNFCCRYCGNEGTLYTKTKTDFEREHKIPVSLGGGYTRSNVTASCWRCNRKKNNKTEEEFITYMRLHPKEFPYAKRIP